MLKAQFLCMRKNQELVDKLTLETLLQHSNKRQLALYFSMVRRKLC